MRDTREEQNKWRNILCFWIGRLNIARMLVLPNLIYVFNTISIKIPANNFMDINKLILKFICRGKRYRLVDSILVKKPSRRADTT